MYDATPEESGPAYPPPNCTLLRDTYEVLSDAAKKYCMSIIDWYCVR